MCAQGVELGAVGGVGRREVHVQVCAEDDNIRAGGNLSQTEVLHHRSQHTGALR